MVRPNCAFNSATALRRVFMPSNLGTSDCLHVTRIFVPALIMPLSSQQVRAYVYLDRNTTRNAGTWGSPSASTTRRDTVQPAAAFPKRENKPSNRPPPRVKTKMARLPRDDEIREQYVHMQVAPPKEPERKKYRVKKKEVAKVDENGEEGVEVEGVKEVDEFNESEEVDEFNESEEVDEVDLVDLFEQTYGQVSDTMELKSVLAGLDRKTQSLHVIALPDHRLGLEWPICRIVNKKEEFQKQQQEKEKQKIEKATSKQKEMEINWVVAPHDLEHKLKQLQQFLARGYRVQVLLLKKPRTKVKAKEKDGKELLEKIEQATAEVQGSKEWKKREGPLLGSMKIFLQGSSQGGKQGKQGGKQEATKQATKDGENDGEKDGEASSA